MDVTDIINYNIILLNRNDLANSFFCLSQNDPTFGFAYDASTLAGHTYPDTPAHASDLFLDSPQLRHRLGSHFAHHLRHRLETEKGFTCTVGIATNKTLSKLVGNLHKPNDQTTLLPSCADADPDCDNVISFIDNYDISKIPGIGSKLAQKLRTYLLQTSPKLDAGTVYGDAKENVLVAHVRTCPGMGPETLERILGGPGTPYGIGNKIWGLLHGCDPSPVGQARDIPRQISIEDSYLRLDTLEEVTRQLAILSKSLLKRMHTDLVQEDDDIKASKRWVAFPKTIRLTTRPRPTLNPEGSGDRSFARTSRSSLMPGFVFNLSDHADLVCSRLVTETLLPLFRRLHPTKSGWNLSLLNIAAINIMGAASETGGMARDVGKMLLRQGKSVGSHGQSERNVDEKHLGDDGPSRAYKDEDRAVHGQRERHVSEGYRVGYENECPGDSVYAAAFENDCTRNPGSEDIPTASQDSTSTSDNWWPSKAGGAEDLALPSGSYCCPDCGSVMPVFATNAHLRWHAQNMRK